MMLLEADRGKRSHIQMMWFWGFGFTIWCQKFLKNRCSHATWLNYLFEQAPSRVLKLKMVTCRLNSLKWCWWFFGFKPKDGWSFLSTQSFYVQQQIGFWQWQQLHGLFLCPATGGQVQTVDEFCRPQLSWTHVSQGGGFAIASCRLTTRQDVINTHAAAHCRDFEIIGEHRFWNAIHGVFFPILQGLATKRPISAEQASHIEKYIPSLRFPVYGLERCADFLEQWIAGSLPPQPLMDVSAFFGVKSVDLFWEFIAEESEEFRFEQFVLLFHSGIPCI